MKIKFPQPNSFTLLEVLLVVAVLVIIAAAGREFFGSFVTGAQLEATLKNWPLIVTLVDLLWGTLLTACVSVVTIILVKYFS